MAERFAARHAADAHGARCFSRHNVQVSPDSADNPFRRVPGRKAALPDRRADAGNRAASGWERGFTMNMTRKIMLVTIGVLVFTTITVAFSALWQLRRSGQANIRQIENMQQADAERIRADGARQVSALREELLARKKEYLQSQVQTALSVLSKAYADAHDPDRLKLLYRDQLLNATNTAYGILEAIAAEPGAGLEEKQAKAARLVGALRYGPENQDYFWINDLHPRMIMHPYKPELNGTDLTENADPKGKKLFMEFVKVAREKGEGFVDYHWPKYGADQPQPKLSFVKLFKEWGWIIGTGVYIEVTEDKLKSDAAALIGSLRYGPENKDYFWINDAHPRMVMHPYKPEMNGTDLTENADPKGKKLFMEFVKVAKEKGEGFVDYYWPKYGADQPQPKLSFVKLFKEWGWIIGTGLYSDDIDAMVQQKEADSAATIQAAAEETAQREAEASAQIEKRVKGTLGIIALLAGCVLTIGLLVAYFVTRSIARPIFRVIEGMSEGAAQVSSAAGQVASASQQLAEGSSAQAAAIEETSSSLEEMSAMTKQNADHAAQADHLMKDASAVVRKANQSMEQLTGSMAEISNASAETSKIIKTIDEIAFQTNLLALNAAVEAARAGEAGAGFAVVADEVRNLAMRAAEAARNTAALIEGTVKRVKEGSALVTGTSQAFAEVAASTAKVGGIVAEIAAASGEQAEGIGQINKAVTDMDKITQQNAANAEESASASEEMNAQAGQLKAYVAELGAIVGGAGGGCVRPPSKNAIKKKRGAIAGSGDRAVALSGSKGGRENRPAVAGREVRPDQVISLENDDRFKEF